MLRSRANEIRELVHCLGSRSPARVDSARARLAVIGARAVEDLIAALEGDDNRIRAHAMSLLALIQDPRGREPLVAMLLDRNPRLREAAARCLARFPSSEVVAALERVLDKERQETVKVAAVDALVEQYAAGREEALRRVLELLAESRETPRLRLAAVALLPLLRESARRGVLERLKQDPDAQVRLRAIEIAAAGERSAQSDVAEIQRLISALAAEDYASWKEIPQRLAACGQGAIRPLLAEMQSRAHDPEYCTRAGMALKAMGPRRGRALADALDEIEEPLPLQVLVETIGALGEKSLIYRLKDLIDRLALEARHPAGVNGPDMMQRVRAKAHLELARIGSRVAIQDLREAVADPDRRLEIELIAALELIGKKEEIGPLLQSYAQEDDFMCNRIAGVVRSIMKREKIRRNDKMFQALSRDQRRALNEFLPPSGPVRKRSVRPGHGPPGP